jgi:hypothetical protein
MRLALLVPLALSVLAARPQEKLTLTHKFKKGEVVRYEMTMTSGGEFGGMEMKQEIVVGMVFEPEDVTEGGLAKVKVTYDRVKFKMEGPMESDYDSERDKEAPEDTMGKVMAGMLGKSFTAQITARGEVASVKGYAEMMEKVLEGIGDDDPMLPMIKGQFTDEYAQKSMQMAFVKFPKKEVGKGDSWEDETQMPLGGVATMKLKAKHTIKEIAEGGKEAVFTDETGMEAEDGGGGMVQITEAKGSGETRWDVENGRMKSQKGTMTLKMEAGGNEFEMKMTMEVKYAPKEKKTPTKDEKKDK